MQHQTKVAAAAQLLCSLQFQPALQSQELQVHPPWAGDPLPLPKGDVQMGAGW